MTYTKWRSVTNVLFGGSSSADTALMTRTGGRRESWMEPMGAKPECACRDQARTQPERRTAARSLMKFCRLIDGRARSRAFHDFCHDELSTPHAGFPLRYQLYVVKIDGAPVLPSTTLTLRTASRLRSANPLPILCLSKSR